MKKPHPDQMRKEAFTRCVGPLRAERALISAVLKLRIVERNAELGASPPDRRVQDARQSVAYWKGMVGHDRAEVVCSSLLSATSSRRHGEAGMTERRIARRCMSLAEMS